MANKQIKNLDVESSLTDTHALMSEDLNLATPLTKRFSLLALKSYILSALTLAWANITNKPFTAIDTTTLDTTTVGEVVTLKVKDGVYATSSALDTKLELDDFIEGSNVTLTKNAELNQITISSTIPTGSATVIGGFKVGTNLSVTDGVLSATGEVGASVEWVDVLNRPFATIDTNTLEVATNVLGVKTGVYANKSTTSNATLVSTTWVGTEAPYTYTLTLSGVNDTNVVEVLPISTITTAQEESLALARISNGTQSTDSIVLQAFGVKPTIDLPLTFIIRGDL